jgi:energy-coupling factor transporter ATP-binding protein EcfA2
VTGEAVTIDVVNQCPDYKSYRAARVKSLFNVDAGNEFAVRAELPLDQMPDWSIGVVVGPSGSGKSTIGRALWDGAAWHEPGEGWDPDAPIIDCVDPGGDFDAATGALSAVGLGDVPAWLRPYHVLSTGQKFRADLARIVAEAPDRVVVDEFTSTVDRQIAKIGAGAFSKSWKRTGGQAVLLTCHYDVLEWLEPDWVYDTGSNVFEFTRGCLQRPRLDVDIRVGTWSVWPFFEHAVLQELRRGGRRGSRRAPRGVVARVPQQGQVGRRREGVSARGAAGVAGRGRRDAVPEQGRRHVLDRGDGRASSQRSVLDRVSHVAPGPGVGASA